MTAESKNASANVQFGLTLAQKVVYGIVLLGVSLLVVPLTPVFNRPGGMVLFVLFGLLIGVCSWFISAGWTFKVELTPSEIRVRDSGRLTVIPLDKVGMVVRGGRIPFLPSVWLVLRGVDVGRSLPTGGVDPHTQELLAGFQKRNPGKRITYVPLPGGYLRSVGGFVAELKRRIPPLTIDDRLGGK
jgi:hypothetical protein